MLQVIIYCNPLLLFNKNVSCYKTMLFYYLNANYLPYDYAFFNFYYLILLLYVYFLYL